MVQKILLGHSRSSLDVSLKIRNQAGPFKTQLESHPQAIYTYMDDSLTERTKTEQQDGGQDPI